MNVKSITWVLGIVALMISGSVFAQTQVPNTFQAGQPARAADVNANFSAVESAVNDNDSRITANENDIAANSAAINDNDTRITANANDIAANSAPVYVVLDSTGQQVGDTVIHAEDTLANVSFSLLLSTGETLEFIAHMNGQGFLVPNNTANSVFYSQSDCVGQAYIDTYSPELFLTPVLPVAILKPFAATAGSPAELWRATSDIPATFQLLSVRRIDSNGNVSCQNTSFLSDPSLPATFEVDLHQLFIPPFTLQRVN